MNEEIKLALRKGYQVLRVLETYHYPARTPHLFRSYVTKFQKAKEEASGWSAHVTMPKQREVFLWDCGA